MHQDRSESLRMMRQVIETGILGTSGVCISEMDENEAAMRRGAARAIRGPAP